MAWQLEAHIRNNGLIDGRFIPGVKRCMSQLLGALTSRNDRWRSRVIVQISLTGLMPSSHHKANACHVGEGVEQLSWTDLESAFAEDVEHDSPDASSLVEDWRRR